MVAGSTGSLKVALTAVPVTTLLLPWVLVGVLVAPLLGLVESTVKPCATQGIADTARTAASDKGVSHDCGISWIPNFFTFCTLSLSCNEGALDLRR
jgi:hypothetical protein